MGYAIPGAVRRHPRFLRVSLSAVALGAGLAAAGPAAADNWHAGVVSLGNPSIAVAGNGNSYVSVDPSSGNIDGQIKVWLDAGVSGRIKSFEAWPSLKYANGVATAFKGTGISLSKSYSYPRPKQVEETFFFSIPRAHYQQYVVAACNAQADLLRAQGLNNNAIFSQDRSVEVQVTAGVKQDMSGPNNVNPSPNKVSAAVPFTVTCKRLPPRVPNPIADSSLLIRTEKASNYACELRLHGVISTYTPNVQAKFRYIHADGQKSDLKTVTTDAQGFVNFTHIYPLAPGIKSGKIRMVGEGPTFQSDWADYETDCDLPPQDIASVLPPKAAEILFSVSEEVAHRGLLCPSVISIDGLLEGRGKASGAAALFADGQLKKLQQYSIEDGHSVLVQGDHALTWGPTQAQQNVKLSMNVTNSLAAIVDQLEKTVNVVCRQVQTSGVGQGAPGGVAPVADNGDLPPAPIKAPELTLAVSTKKEKLYQGFICPAEVLVDGRIIAQDAMEGRAIHIAAQHQSLPEAQSQVSEQNFSVVKDQHYAVSFEPEMRWSNVSAVGGNPPKQTMKFTFQATRHHKVVAETQKSVVLSCRKVETTGVAQGAVGGVSTGNPAPTHSQQAAVGQLALPQAFAIQAPQGLARGGEIRLSGGAANAKYKLTFLRKQGGGYVAVNAAQLPKQMTGLAASFPLKALSGGRDWRLEVCPLGGAPTACKTSDFRLPRLGAGAGAGSGAQAPAPAAGSTVYIVPGALN